MTATDYRKGTKLTITYPWGLYVRKGSKALCSDGKVRSLAYLAETADTFFSVPAAVRVHGKYVTGYVTTEETECGGLCVCFRQHTEQKHTGTLPPWPQKFTPEWEALLTE